MKARGRVIEPMFLRGSSELGLATGFTDKRIHELWRASGLPYCSNGKTFIYDSNDVRAFIKKFYAVQQINSKLKNL